MPAPAAPPSEYGAPRRRSQGHRRKLRQPLRRFDLEPREPSQPRARVGDVPVGLKLQHRPEPRLAARLPAHAVEQRVRRLYLEIAAHRRDLGDRLELVGVAAAIRGVAAVTPTPSEPNMISAVASRIPALPALARRRSAPPLGRQRTPLVHGLLVVHGLPPFSPLGTSPKWVTYFGPQASAAALMLGARPR